MNSISRSWPKLVGQTLGRHFRRPVGRKLDSPCTEALLPGWERHSPSSQSFSELEGKAGWVNESVPSSAHMCLLGTRAHWAKLTGPAPPLPSKSQKPCGDPTPGWQAGCLMSMPSFARVSLGPVNLWLFYPGHRPQWKMPCVCRALSKEMETQKKVLIPRWTWTPRSLVSAAFKILTPSRDFPIFRLSFWNGSSRPELANIPLAGLVLPHSLCFTKPLD